MAGKKESLEPLSFEDIVRREVQRRKELKKTLTWGEWKLDQQPLTLTHRQEQYTIPLEDMTNSAQILDWIFQLQAKAWATPYTMWSLLSAIEDLLDPQANYCSGGVSKSCDPKKTVEAFFALEDTEV